MSLSEWDLLTFLSIIPFIETLITAYFITGSSGRPPLPITGLLPLGFLAIWLIGELENPSFMFKLAVFIGELLRYDNLLPSFVYLGSGIIGVQVAVCIWFRKLDIGEC